MLAAALGRRLAGYKVGLLAALFLAVMPLHVQQAHFATVDSFLAFFVTGALLFAARWGERGRRADAVWAGLWAGLAVGCKAGALLLACPLAMACWLGTERGGRVRSCAAMAGVGVLAFAVTNPFALIDLPRYLENLAAQSALVRGAVLVPYTLQYHATLPYLHPIAQQLLWGMGPVLGLLAFGGMAVALWRAVRQPPAPAEWVALAWGLPFFAFTGALFVKFPRYLLPLAPLLAVYGAWGAEKVRRRWDRLGSVAAFLAAGWAGLLSLALILSYAAPHPWEAASVWLRETVPPGATIAVEEWDHPLPLDATGYQVRGLPVFDVESAQKRAAMEDVLAAADVVVIASRRGYGTLAGWPERFPWMGEFYRTLFAEEAGFEVVACFERWPRLGPVPLADDVLGAVELPRPACPPPRPSLWLPRLDESFVVYDHPWVIVLRRR